MSLCTCMKGISSRWTESLSTALSDAVEQVLTIFRGGRALLVLRAAEHRDRLPHGNARLHLRRGRFIPLGVGRLPPQPAPPTRPKKGRAGPRRSARHVPHRGALHAFERGAQHALDRREPADPARAQALRPKARRSQWPPTAFCRAWRCRCSFPSSFLSSFASLLIPKIAREFEQKHTAPSPTSREGRRRRAAIQRVLRRGLFAFGEDWGRAFLQQRGGGRLPKILAPLVPLLYLDVVVDSLLKGLNEQLNSMKYNFTDSLIRVLLVLCFMRFSGMPAYIAILFFSSIFNAMMSVRRLLKVAQVRVRVVKKRRSARFLRAAFRRHDPRGARAAATLRYPLVLLEAALAAVSSSACGRSPRPPSKSRRQKSGRLQGRQPPCSFRADDQPFTAPSVMPETKYFAGTDRRSASGSSR